MTFEQNVLKGLVRCGLDLDSISSKSPLGIAVSGGADSVALLLSLVALFDSEKLRVITVNHGIRHTDESSGDCLFVDSLCKKMEIGCYQAEIPDGLIVSEAKKKGASIEELARDLRYREFESFIKKEGLLALCLAHNRNDQLETILMRFLQGSGSEGLKGISVRRNFIVRPLMDISRNEIESYLHEKKQEWRTDKTNYDTKYLRNRIRNVLIPLLDKNFTGWEKSILSLSKKLSDDESFFKERVDELFKNQNLVNGGCVKIPRDRFYDMHPALARRFFFSALNKISYGGRFPFKLFEEIYSWKKNEKRQLRFENLFIELRDGFLFIALSNLNDSETVIEKGFFYLFENEFQTFESRFFKLYFEKTSGKDPVFLSFESASSEEGKITFPVRFPLCVRSALPGDKVKSADKKQKSLSEIFSDWKIPPALRQKIPVIEELCPETDSSTGIKAVFASCYGFKNWIVK